MSNAYAQLAADLWEEHAPASHKTAVAGTFGAGGLAAIIQWLRDNGVTISKIISFIVPIIQQIVAGGLNWQSIVTAIWNIIFPNTPLPPLPTAPVIVTP